jgi:histidine triad (HIT) family protein
VSEDFYCDEALSGRTPVKVVLETGEVLAFHHTRPFWPVHIVVIPKTHVPSLIDLGDTDEVLLHKVLAVVRRVADQVTREYGACRVLTNLGRYQDSKHLHFHVNAGEPLPSLSESAGSRPRRSGASPP